MWMRRETFVDALPAFGGNRNPGRRMKWLLFFSILLVLLGLSLRHRGEASPPVVAPVARPDLSAWEGPWKNGDAVILFKPNGTAIYSPDGTTLLNCRPAYRGDTATWWRASVWDSGFAPGPP